MKVVLVGYPVGDGMERHALPGVMEYVFARAGELFFERDLIGGGKIARARWWRKPPDGKEVLLYELLSQT